MIFHTGHSGIGSGMYCGGKLRLEYSNPMHLDDVAVNFGDMQIVMAHPSFPWRDEGFVGQQPTSRTCGSTSGWSQSIFPKQLVQYANTLLKDRVLFGSDYPLITPERWMKDFGKQGSRPEVMPGILKGNAGAAARARSLIRCPAGATPPRPGIGIGNLARGKAGRTRSGTVARLTALTETAPAAAPPACPRPSFVAAPDATLRD